MMPVMSSSSQFQAATTTAEDADGHDNGGGGVYSEPLYSYPATAAAAPTPTTASTLRMDSDLTLVCDQNTTSHPTRNNNNLQLYGTLPRRVVMAEGALAPKPRSRTPLADSARTLSKSSLYLFEGTPTTNAADFFAAQTGKKTSRGHLEENGSSSQGDDDVFESSHYKQVQRGAPHYVTLQHHPAPAQGGAGFLPTSHLLCGPMVPMASAAAPRPSPRWVQAPSGANGPSSSTGKQPLTKKKSISLENLVEVPELENVYSSSSSGSEQEEEEVGERRRRDPICLPVPPDRSSLKAPSLSAESTKRSLTVTFVDPGGAGEKEVEEMESTPRRFFQAVLSPVLDAVTGRGRSEKAQTHHQKRTTLCRTNSLAMDHEPSPSAPSVTDPGIDAIVTSPPVAPKEASPSADNGSSNSKRKWTTLLGHCRI